MATLREDIWNYANEALEKQRQLGKQGVIRIGVQRLKLPFVVLLRSVYGVMVD